MTEGFIEQTMRLIKTYEDISPIIDDVIKTKTKEGETILLTKVSLAEKLKCRDQNNKISIEICMNDYLNPEKKKIAKSIFDNISIIVEAKGSVGLKTEISAHKFNEGFDSYLEQNPDNVVKFCKNALVKIDPTLLNSNITLQRIDVGKANISMKMEPEEKEDLVEERLNKRW